MAYPNLPPAPQPAAASPASTNVAFNTSLRMDLAYLTTTMGILRIFIIVLNALGAICIGSSAFSGNGRGVLFTVVALIGLCYTALLLAAYSSHAVEKWHHCPWLKVEMGAAVALALLDMITSTVVVAFGSAAYSAAGFFGYLCMVSYGGEVFLRGRARQRGEPAQGQVLACKRTAPAPPGLGA